MAEMKKLSDIKGEEISAFAFDTGKSLETFLRLVTDNLEAKSRNYEMQILSFRDIIAEREDAGLMALYYKHFNIKTANDDIAGSAT